MLEASAAQALSVSAGTAGDDAMSDADHAYHMRRAEEEQARAERALTPEARTAHEQLRDMYRGRAGHPVDDSSFTPLAGGKA
jgi:hypothetical protein